VFPNTAYSYKKLLASPQPFATQAHVGRGNVLDGQGQPQGFEACCDGILQPGPHVSQDLVATWQPHSTQQPVHSSGLFIMIDPLPDLCHQPCGLPQEKNTIVNR
jgi:hypothetical protein